MNTEEERKAFEAWFDNQVVNAIPDANLSMQKLWALSAWQASANREGYKLVPVDKMMGCLYQIGDRSYVDDNVSELKAMIGAAE